MNLPYPDVWSEGQLFAFSGFDGPTDWAHPLVGATLGEGRGFLFYPPGGFMDRGRPPSVRVVLVLPDGRATPVPARGLDVVDRYVLSDLAEFVVSGDDWSVTVSCLWYDKDTLLFAFRGRGALPAGLEAGVLLGGPDADEASVGFGDSRLCVLGATPVRDGGALRFTRALDGRGRAVLALIRQGPGSTAGSVDLDALDASVIRRARLDFYRRLAPPRTDDPLLAKTYYKCASVMRVNAESAQGAIASRWTTPDRWPHKHMWLWDSAFHALGYKYLDAGWGRDCISSVLCAQRDDGFIAHYARPDGKTSGITQPPVLAWAALDVYRYAPDEDFLKQVYPGLCAYIEWDLANLDPDGDGLFSYGDDDSGMDNSPRFDADTPHTASIDLNCYLVNDMRALAEMADELKRPAEAERWRERADELSKLINDRLWDERTGFYYDRGASGRFVKIKTEAGFTPLFAGVAGKEQAARLVEHLTDRSEFWTPVPVPSVAADEPTFCDDMWRGPMWVNHNFFIVQGLLRYGWEDLSRELAERTVREIARWYARDGVIYEFYDAQGRVDPWDLHRKGRTNRTVRDYNFTAALYAELLQRYVGGEAGK